MPPRKPSKRSAQAPDPPVQPDSPRPCKSARKSNSKHASSKHNHVAVKGMTSAISAAEASQELSVPVRLHQLTGHIEGMLADIFHIMRTGGIEVKIDESELKRMQMASKVGQAELNRIQQAKKDEQAQHVEFLAFLARCDAGELHW